jgi:hypothetical protein
MGTNRLHWLVEGLHMMRTVPRVAFLIATIALSAIAPAQAEELAGLIAKRNELVKGQDWKKVLILADEQREVVLRMLREDRLKTVEDFWNAAQVAASPFGSFEPNQYEHELTITAMMLGKPEAIKRASFTWDRLMLSMGRDQRFANVYRMEEGKRIPYRQDPDGPSINLAAVFMNTEGAKKRAAAAKDNPELQKLCDEDQAVRQDPIDEAKRKKMQVEDPIRKARVLELLKQNVPVTARDFYNCSLVLQHGGDFRAYMMAHELILGAFILGEKESPWLISRTYDRMLLSVGHRQRYGTQWSTGGLEPITDNGPSDTMRQMTRTDSRAKLAERHQKMRSDG